MFTYEFTRANVYCLKTEYYWVLNIYNFIFSYITVKLLLKSNTHTIQCRVYTLHTNKSNYFLK